MSADVCFPVNYAVYGPGKESGKERVVLDGEKERQGDYVFTATEIGEYRFCFDNTMSTFSDKIVDFEISVGQAHQAQQEIHWLTRSRSRTNRERTSLKKQEPAQNNSAALKRQS